MSTTDAMRLIRHFSPDRHYVFDAECAHAADMWSQAVTDLASKGI